MNELTLEDIRLQLAIDIGNTYTTVDNVEIGDKAMFAGLCADAGILYLTNQKLAVSSENPNKAVRKKRREDLKGIKNFIRENVDFQPSGFVVSIFWSIIAPMIINWIAKRIYELLS